MDKRILVSWVNQWFKFDQTWVIGVIGLSGRHARDTKNNPVVKCKRVISTLVPWTQPDTLNLKND